MPLIILTFIIQCCFVYHVFKTGRPAWWAYVILGAPVVGCIAYYFIEIFPGSREHLTASRATRDIARTLNPDKDLKRRLEAVEIAPTVENKVALAQEWLRCGRGQEAIDLYRETSTGPHADDPDLALGLARAYVAAGDFAQARAIAEELRAKHGKFRENDVALLHARALEGLSEDASALDEYERLQVDAQSIKHEHDRLQHHARALQQENERLRAEIDRARKELAELDAGISHAIEVVTDLHSRLNKELDRDPTR